MSDNCHHIIKNETGPQEMIGYVLGVDKDNGHGRVWLDIAPQHLNRHGSLHGGIVGTLLDTISGFTASLSFDEKGLTPCMSISLNMNFIAGAREGRVVGSAKITGRGRTLFFIDAVLKNEEGVIIATSSGVFKAHRKPPTNMEN
ncbi:MAG: thioesterase [Robiginitomaculum sp.]|nr:MAG: thioesterase [Robiginitomaculum sp.]